MSEGWSPATDAPLSPLSALLGSSKKRRHNESGLKKPPREDLLALHLQKRDKPLPPLRRRHPRDDDTRVQWATIGDASA